MLLSGRPPYMTSMGHERLRTLARSARPPRNDLVIPMWEDDEL